MRIPLRPWNRHRNYAGLSAPVGENQPGSRRLGRTGERALTIHPEFDSSLDWHLSLLIVIVLLYFSTRSIPKILIVLLAVPFSLIGAFWLIYLLGYNMSVAVWVGIIALAGVDAETGVVMLLYLDQSFARFKVAGRMNSLAELQGAVEDGAVKRIRPKMMTVMAILMGLLPIMWSHGAGADVMKRIAAPMVGGVVTSFALELLIYPVIFTLWKWHAEVKHGVARPAV